MNVYNSIFATFESLVDLDMGIFRFTKDRFSGSEYIDKLLLNMPEDKIKLKFLNRTEINPLTVIMPNVDTEDLYKEIIDKYYKDILKFSNVYDTYKLLITFLNRASSLNITISCNNDMEYDFLKRIKCPIKIEKIEDRSKANLENYTVIWEKYFFRFLEYEPFNGKHIIAASAKFNFNKDNDHIKDEWYNNFKTINLIRTMDLYTDIKYKITIKGEDESNEDIQ